MNILLEEKLSQKIIKIYFVEVTDIINAIKDF